MCESCRAPVCVRQTDSRRLRWGRQEAQLHRFWFWFWSTSLGLSDWSFLMTGNGWASVLKTQWSNGSWSSSEKSR